MPPFSSQHHAVLETIPCDYTELLVRHLYQRIQTKARSQICSSRTAHHANLRGRLLPAADAGVAFMDISAHVLGPMKATQQTWRARFSSEIYFRILYSFLFFRVALSFGTSRYFIFASYFIAYFFHDTFFLEAFKMGVKIVRTITIVMFLPRCRLSALHDRSFRSSRFIVRRFTIVCFDRAALSFSASR